MTQDEQNPGQPPDEVHTGPAGPSDADEERALALAHRVFELARNGAAYDLYGYLDHGVPVNSTDTDGNTLLMLAATHGHSMTVRALLQRGADPDRINDRGQTPLTGAVFTGKRDVLTALLDTDADPYLGTPNALETARFFGRADLLELLEVEHLEVEQQNDDGT